MPQPASYRILVLDDDPVLLQLVTAFLSMAGHQTTAVSSSEAALAKLNNRSDFDVVLTDLNMPGLEGHALVAALRAATPATVPLVGMSATQPSPETQALFDAFLPKPFDPPKLQDVINAAIQRHSARNLSPLGVPHPQNSHPVLDETIFQSLARTIPPAQLGKLYEMGIADIEKRLVRIHEAAAISDLATIQREAHAIKGSCGMVGARELQALATAIEDGTTLDTAALEQIPPACLRLRRMLGDKLQTE